MNCSVILLLNFDFRLESLDTRKCRSHHGLLLGHLCAPLMLSIHLRFCCLSIFRLFSLSLSLITFSCSGKLRDYSKLSNFTFVHSAFDLPMYFKLLDPLIHMHIVRLFIVFLIFFCSKCFNSFSNENLPQANRAQSIFVQPFHR